MCKRNYSQKRRLPETEVAFFVRFLVELKSIMKNLYITTVLLGATLAFVSCGDDDSTFAPRTDDESAEYSSADDTATSSSAKFADYRDGRVYKTVKIGNQEWMAENLNFKGSLAQETWCYENKAEFCAKYGLLYAWNAAIKACPGGWHLPDTTEWNSLILTVGGIETAGSALKSASGWENNGNGTDAYGFKALPAGHRAVGFADEKRIAFFWSSTENIDNFAYYTAVGFEDDSTHQGPIYKELAFSVRCIKD